ncbi:MAG TPA: polymer-forming cytoskeletal protein [Thermoanaerobaculia bacterium]|nr:polymer-forming cytoskeletal protein [Thermoanaerobaculia bacterium]
MALFSKDPAPAAPPLPRREGQQAAPGTTFLGANITIEGTLGGSEPVVIEGAVKGHVKLSGDLLVGTKARLEATVHARNITIEGRVTGDISADERVELIASASVDGNIKAPKIVVAEGAHFRGSVDMGSQRPRESAEPASKK